MRTEVAGNSHTETLLTGLLRQYFTGAPDASLPSAIDWHAFQRLALAHKVAPLALHCLANDGYPAPQAVIDGLRRNCAIAVGRNLQLTQELIRLAQLFEGRKIPVLPVKGPVLAQALHQNLALRPSNDLDLLVRPRDLAAACRLLEDLGFRNEFAHWPAWRHRAYGMASGHHYGYEDARRGLRVELHWRLSPGKLAWPLETEEFWARQGQHMLAGTPVRCPPPEDLLLILCIHGARHWWCQLGLLCDVAALLRRYPELDWEAATARARAIGGRRALHLGLLLTQQVLGVELPPPIRAAAEADRTAHSLARDARRMLSSGIDLEAELLPRWSFYLRLRERLRDRARYALGQSLNSLFWRGAPAADSDHPGFSRDEALAH